MRCLPRRYAAYTKPEIINAVIINRIIIIITVIIVVVWVTLVCSASIGAPSVAHGGQRARREETRAWCPRSTNAPCTMFRASRGA